RFLATLGFGLATATFGLGACGLARSRFLTLRLGRSLRLGQLVTRDLTRRRRKRLGLRRPGRLARARVASVVGPATLVPPPRSHTPPAPATPPTAPAAVVRFVEHHSRAPLLDVIQDLLSRTDPLLDQNAQQLT